MQLAYLLAAVVVLIYSSMQVSVAAKCKKAAVDDKTSQTLKYVNTTMIVLSVVAILYLSWKMFVPAAGKASISSRLAQFA
jgi:uncharacterized membrane protein YukC